MASRRPKTGEKREVRQPFNLDRLPIEVRDAIQQLRAQGRTWTEIEEISALPFGDGNAWRNGKGGFVNWEALPTRTLELFPDMRLPKSTLQRWYDVRVEQVQQEVLAKSARARELAAVFAKGTVHGADEATLNALRDQIFALMEASDIGSRAAVIKCLTSLGFLQARIRQLDIEEHREKTRERELEAKLDVLKKKAASLVRKLEGAKDGDSAITSAQVLAQVKEIYGAA